MTESTYVSSASQLDHLQKIICYVYLLEWELGVWISPILMFIYLFKEGSGSPTPGVPLIFGLWSAIPTPIPTLTSFFFTLP